MITQEEHKIIVSKTWQKSKEDLNELLLTVYPKYEFIAEHNSKVQAMYENLIALRNIALTPYNDKN